MKHMWFARPVSAPIAILLGAIGFALGFFGFVGLARLDAPPFLAIGVPVVVAAVAGILRRRDVAVGIVMGTASIVLLVVAALRSWN